MTDFPAHMIDTPCVVLGTTFPAGTYDKDGSCVIKVPFAFTRPDGVTYGGECRIEGRPPHEYLTCWDSTPWKAPGYYCGSHDCELHAKPGIEEPPK